MLIIGNTERPRPFQGKCGREIGIVWHFNKKAWITQVIFYNWLKRLDGYIGATLGRDILLLTDNCTAHAKEDSLPTLQSVQVSIISPNTTSRVQPLDAGVIAWIKRRYKRWILLSDFDNLEAEAKRV